MHMAAPAEYRHRGCEPPRSLAFVSVGSRIGLGLVLAGRIHRGAHNQPGIWPGPDASLPEADMAQRASVTAGSSAR
jgi:hypothetical protein